jgi:poly(hydroxyalkanoate) depolymerase family esterase
MQQLVQDLMNQAVRLTWGGHAADAGAVMRQPIVGTGHGHGGPGAFSSASHTDAGLTRTYKLYVPPGRAGRSLPLVVMLHGASQYPDDFAAGTAMNERAREQGFFVLYPAQSLESNPARCWNWFRPDHQQRGRGEPALIAAMTRAVMAAEGIDAGRVYIAGLSAGGAMAAIVADAYPELFSAVGVHSGVPRGAANDVAGALAVMRSGNVQPRLPVALRRASVHAGRSGQRAVPTIVFHGDHDQTVHPRNGEQLIAALLADAASAAAPRRGGRESAPRVDQGVTPQGRHYTRLTHRGALAEHWLLHGAGHAWSGGCAAGSYTDAKGPDATREMLRFFFDQPLRTAAAPRRPAT